MGKDALPDGTKVSKEASQAIAKAASVFVLYATSCSNQIASRANRKTIGGQDVISAMEDMDFDKFVRPLEVNLEGWKESQQKKKDAKRKPGEDKRRTTLAPLVTKKTRRIKRKKMTKFKKYRHSTVGAAQNS